MKRFPSPRYASATQIVRPYSRKAAESRLRLKYEFPTLQLMHLHEVRPRKDKGGVDLISDALPFGQLLVWQAEEVRY